MLLASPAAYPGAAAGIKQAFRVYEVACQDQPKLLIAACSELALHPDRDCSLNVRIEALQGNPSCPQANGLMAIWQVTSVSRTLCLKRFDANAFDLHS